MANNPTLLKMPLATDGEKAAIPETTGSTTGKFSQQYGFQAINALPLQAGGVAPKREDFNGAFNLLGGVAFYAQKGWVFEYDSTQDYYKGCIVIDPSDGNKYECIADMSAGTVAPHSDSFNTYWKDANFLIKQITPAYNKRDEITTSGTYTAPVTGWYKITLKGGGGGGQGGVVKTSSTKYLCAGGGGGEGGTTIAYQYMTKGTSCSVAVGAGGAGGTAQSASSPNLLGHEGSDGGSTTITIGATSYVATGGKGAAGSGGMGGTGTINGAAGGGRNVISGDTDVATFSARGGSGGGVGGATTHTNSSTTVATQGGGGGGGVARTDTTPYANTGGAGGDGYVWFEYWED